MTGVKFGVGLFPIEPLPRMLTLVKLSEEVGFSCAYIGDFADDLARALRDPRRRGDGHQAHHAGDRRDQSDHPRPRRTSGSVGDAARDGGRPTAASELAPATARWKRSARSRRPWPIWSGRSTSLRDLIGGKTITSTETKAEVQLTYAQ